MNQRVLITAAASGIGFEIARAFRDAGANVFVCDIDPDALKRLPSALPGVNGTVCDVGDRVAVPRMIEEAVSVLGGLDVLINNAGTGGPTAPVAEFDPLEWDKVVAVNLTGTFNVSRWAIPHLTRSHAGVIINMSSAAGRFGYPLRSAYAASKWGVVGLTKTLSMELGEYGIRVNAILPGGVEGPRAASILQARATATGRSVEDVKKSFLTKQSIKRFVTPQEIAALAVFIASDSGRSISGQILPIDNDLQSE
jgi:NAD(P)-dependent dehydrogenase (short-subunit alcohol dehydrogenase family)